MAAAAAAGTSFHAEKCCHVVSADAASAPGIRNSVRQFLIRINAFVYLFNSTQLKFIEYIIAAGGSVVGFTPNNALHYRSNGIISHP